MYGVSDKFRVRVYVRDIEHFKRFLPGSPLALEIADAIFLYVGDEYDWDMELAIPAGKITPVRLGENVQLGWTSWMAPNWLKTDETIRRDARFHVVNRLKQRRRASKAS
jgi:type VI secretion system protein ImpH